MSCGEATSDASAPPESPVFPAEEIEWDGETLSYQGKRYRPGDRIDVGGGQMPLKELTGLSLPKGCPDGIRPFIIA